MQIICNEVTQLENDQQVLFTLTDDDLIEYEWHCGVPKIVGDVQEYLDANIERYMLGLRKKEYPDCPSVKKIDLETIEGWIEDSCIIPAVLDDDENVITPERVAEKAEWQSTHPEPDPLLVKIEELEARIVELEN